MKIVMQKLSIEDDGTEIIHIDNFSMTLKPKILDDFSNGLSSVLSKSINQLQEEVKKG